MSRHADLQETISNVRLNITFLDVIMNQYCISLSKSGFMLDLINIDLGI